MNNLNLDLNEAANLATSIQEKTYKRETTGHIGSYFSDKTKTEPVQKGFRELFADQLLINTKLQNEIFNFAAHCSDCYFYFGGAWYTDRDHEKIISIEEIWENYNR